MYPKQENSKNLQYRKNYAITKSWKSFFNDFIFDFIAFSNLPCPCVLTVLSAVPSTNYPIIKCTFFLFFLGDWDPLRLKSSSSPVSFSTLTLNPLKALKNARYKDDIESLVVRKGCRLDAFRELDCTGAKATFDARDKNSRFDH